MDEIESARRCIPVVQSIIEAKTQDRVVKIYPISNERHFIFETEKKMKYYQVFKRNFFMSFGRIFADQGMSGIGESLNEEAVAYAMVQGIHSFIFAYEDGKIYTISVKEFHDYAVSHDTIRKTDKTGEKTYSVPIKMLVRWN